MVICITSPIIDRETSMKNKKAEVHKWKKGEDQGKVHTVMSEFKHGTLHSGSGAKVKSRPQAIAIALSEQRKQGKKKK